MKKFYLLILLSFQLTDTKIRPICEQLAEASGILSEINFICKTDQNDFPKILKNNEFEIQIKKIMKSYKIFLICKDHHMALPSGVVTSYCFIDNWDDFLKIIDFDEKNGYYSVISWYYKKVNCCDKLIMNYFSC